MYTHFHEKNNPVVKLTNQINTCLFEIGKFDFQKGDLAELRHLYNKLCSFQDNFCYSNISRVLNRTVCQQMNSIANYLASLGPIVPECSIQIPSDEDIQSMRGMSAGDGEDQRERLGNMVNVLRDCSNSPIYTTNDFNLPNHWLHLFAVINQGDYGLAESAFQKIPKHDFILEPLLTVHLESYLLELIEYSINAQSKNKKCVKLNDDLIVTPRTFEVLIRDLAITLANESTMCFSFGLPTHHAYGLHGAGFCFINKPAVLMNHFQLRRKNESIQYIVMGTDVNRDDGLCSILREEYARKFTCHVDLFDSRVYPTQNQAVIRKEFNYPPLAKEEGIQYLYHRDYEYYAVDLSLTPRETNGVHPAIVFALQKMEKSIADAIFYGRKIVLLFTGGWDAHLDETACCGKYVNNKWMTKSEAQKTRFSDDDFKHFYTEVMALYMANKNHIKKFYWGLEGGYNRTMYENQIELMMNSVDNALYPEVYPSFRQS